MMTLLDEPHGATGDYEKIREKLSVKYPNLANSDYKLWAKPGQYAGPPRLVCFQFSAGSTKASAPDATHFTGLEELKLFLDQSQTTNTNLSPVRRLFLLEGLHSSYVTELGQKLKIDPRVWLRHRRVALWEKAIFNAGNSPRLPSVLAEESSFCLEYCQLMHLNLISQDFSVRCAENERHIASSRSGGVSNRALDGIGMVHRKASFWSQKLDNGGWTALLIVDEQLKRVLGGTESDWHMLDQNTPPKPFQGGYQDFIPLTTVRDSLQTSGPPRTSTFDDLCYYFKHHPDCLNLTQEPVSCTDFMLKMVASEYVQLTQYIHTLLSHLAWLLSRRQTFHDIRINWVEECWSDLVTLQRRLDDHRRNLDAIKLLLRSSNAWETSKGWNNPKSDFQFIDERCLQMKEKAESLVAVFSGLASLVANRQSLTEARGASALAFVGTIFVPMSLIASILSLPNSYQPGEAHFYQYWVISIPIVCLLCSCSMWYLKRRVTRLD